MSGRSRSPSSDARSVDLVDREGAAAVGQQDGVLVGHDALEQPAQPRRVEQVACPNASAQGAVGVGRPDAALGRAYAVGAEARLHRRIEGGVVGQDQVRAGGESQPGGGDATRLEHLDLVEQHPWVDHHAMGNDRRDVGM